MDHGVAGERLDHGGGVMLDITVAIGRSALLRHPLWGLIFIITVAAAVTLGVEHHRVQVERGRAAAAVLAASNAVAERDSTREVARENARVAALLGDSLHAVEKRVVQVQQRRDALDRALGGERRARYALVATVDSLRAVVPSAAPGGERRLGFTLRRPPYSVVADVAIPEPPDSARMELSVALDSMPLDLRVRCIRAGAAAVAAMAPPWAQVKLGALEQAPEVCAVPVEVQRTPPRVSIERLVIGVGLVGRSPRAATLGWFVGAGVAIRS